jgi:hypothetical protein
MHSDDDKNESIKKHYEIKLSNDFIHLIEPITRARDEFKASVEPYLGTIQKLSDSAITIGQKIEPLLKIQQQLTDSAFSINAVMQKIPTIDSTRLSYLSEGAIQAGKSLQTIQDLTLKSSSLFREVNYDLLINPISSALSIAVDNVALQQKTILGDLDSIAKIGTIVSPRFNKWNNTLLEISDVALETLRESPYLFPDLKTTTIPVFKDPTTERIERLEDEVKDLKDKQEKDSIIKIDSEVEKLLSKIDDSLSKMFKGAYAVINQNDDSLAQSAESMTRLLEKLPFCLVKNFESQENTKEKTIKEILAIHLSIKYDSVNNINHPLIDQQHYFYKTFSQIRHRNDKIYKEFEKDPARYKALLLQVEGFLYQLIKQ